MSFDTSRGSSRSGDSMAVRGMRALSGASAAGVVVLTFVVIGTAYLGADRGFPGPGTISIAAHVVASVAVIAAQLWTDRARGVVAVWGSLGVMAVAALLLWTQWWG